MLIISGKNFIYAQSGGVTAVINATASAVIRSARAAGWPGSMYAAQNGILGILRGQIYNLDLETDEAIAGLEDLPGGVFGSCRYKLPDPNQDPDGIYTRLFEVFKAYGIGYLLYNGGNDSQDTTQRIIEASRIHHYDIVCIGIPKTIDNDLAQTDNCPGFGSVAKYVAVSIDEAELDIASMCETSTKVFIMEVMGRHAGWIVSACGLGNHSASRAKNRILLFPEIPFDTERFLNNVQAQVDEQGYAVIGASEGTADKNGTFLAQSGQKDSFGHNQLGGVAPYLAQLIQHRLELKCHWAVADYLQRSARHLVSATDLQQAKAVGEAALRMAMDKQSGFMPVITRTSNNPYSWRIDSAPIAGTANVEKKLPRHYITEDGYNITDDGRQYLQPLISGEAWPAYLDGLPKRTPLKLEYIKKKLSHFTL